MKIRYVGKCLLIEQEKEKSLVVGDLHLGYGVALSMVGAPVSQQMFEEMISDLNSVFGEVGRVDRVILLGDVRHDFGVILEQELNDINKILDYLKSMSDKIIVIRGNHDRVLGLILKKRKMKMHNYYFWKDFCFTHGDEDYKELWDKKSKFLVVGHGHPAIELKEKGEREIKKRKCFLAGEFNGKKLIVVPSLIDYYIGSDPLEGEVVLAWDIDFANFDVKIVSETSVEPEALDVGKLKNLKQKLK